MEVTVANSGPSKEGTDVQTYYECGGGRKTFYALTFIILLPFFISLPVMLTQRFVKGVWLDTWGLIVIAIAFAAVMLLVLFELVFSLRAKVDIGSKAVAFVLPRDGGGMTPMFLYRARTVPYDQLESVETYREIYGGSVAPVMMKAVRLVLKSGERIPFGFSNERDEDPRFPFTRIAEQIAERAGVPLIDRGNIKQELHRKMFGLAASGNEIPEAEIDNLNHRHNVFLIGLITVMFVLLALGIGGDVMTMTGDWGERAPTERILINR